MKKLDTFFLSMMLVALLLWDPRFGLPALLLLLIYFNVIKPKKEPKQTDITINIDSVRDIDPMTVTRKEFREMLHKAS